MSIKNYFLRLYIKFFHYYFVCEEEDLLFILSAGRSGSTLLQLKLEQTGEVTIMPETDSSFENAFFHYCKYFLFRSKYQLLKEVLLIFSKGKNWDAMQIDSNKFIESYWLKHDKLNFGNILYHLYSTYKEYLNPEAKYIGEKNPFLTFYLPYLILIFPQARFIHIIRDGRDVACSWNTSFKKYKNIDNAAKRWAFVTNLIQNLKPSFKNRLLEIKYEEFVINEQNTKSNLGNFLDISFDRKINLKNLKSSKKDLLHKHHHGVFEPNHTSSIEKWRKLNKVDLLKLNKLLQPQLKRYKYIE
ncbi:sulfotransferase [Marivirga tractuosa]|uniref:sulfotransferase family protein n=1 Tax=Marivirga tractuosa TaxID=1006 RepID=UPI0035CF61C6